MRFDGRPAFGVRLYGLDAGGLVELARLCEELGYESIWRGEHLVLPERWTPGAEHGAGGPPDFSVATPMLDTVTLLAFLACATTRIRLATGIYLLPLRHPVVTARSVTTLDVLSGGRLILGVAAGWLAEEFAAVGVPLADRGRLLVEGIDALRALWTEDVPAFDGRYYRFSGIRFEPKPAQRPHPPIVLGGMSPLALRRAALHGDGWYGTGTDSEATADRVETLRRLLREAGRDESRFTVTVRVGPRATYDEVMSLAALGVDRVVVAAGDFELRKAAGARGEIEAFAARVLELLNV